MVFTNQCHAVLTYFKCKQGYQIMFDELSANSVTNQ